MLLVLATSVLLAAAAPWVVRWTGDASGWLLGGAAVALAAWLGSIGPSLEVVEWFPGLEVALALRMDGLAQLFAVLVTGMGGLVIVYGGKYLHGHSHVGRYQGVLFLFLASMLGIVLSDDLLLLFVAWELTTIASYFLIGYEHHHEEPRKAARQALLVTHAGGLALLPGFVLLGMAGGTFRISELIERADQVRDHPAYAPILALVLLGAFTKSAQFPFHFWLPRAMQAPTPVSAYLHSATMVKAGVFLLARLAPVLGDTPAFRASLVAVGGASVVVAAVLAYGSTELKRILAYTTVSALGAMVAMIGIGSSKAIEAALLFVLAHALYKAALFLTSGIITHTTHESDAERVHGLWRAMPVTAVAAAVAALSMSGIPPLFGYVAKESLLEASWDSPWLAVASTAVIVFAGAVFVATGLLVGARPFVGRQPSKEDAPRVAAAMWIGPVVLALASVLLALLPWTVEPVLSAAARAVSGETEHVDISLWHGLVPALGFSAASLTLGLLLFATRRSLRGPVARAIGAVARFGPDAAYEAAMKGLSTVAETQTRILQNGRLRIYAVVTLLTAVGVIAWRVSDVTPQPPEPPLGEVPLHLVGLTLVILAAAIASAVTPSRLASVAAMGVIGIGVAMIFALHGAPDLAMTQFAIESLTVVLFVLVFLRVPRFVRPAGPGKRIGDALVAMSVGAAMTTLLSIATTVRLGPAVSDYFARESVPSAHAHNVVNAILVDFRALDTLGEITVLATAAVGALVVLRLRVGAEEAT